MNTSVVLLLVFISTQVEDKPAEKQPVQRVAIGRLPINPPGVPPQALAADQSDEALLGSVEVPTDPLSLTTFLRKQKINTSDLPRINELIRKLGDDDFDERQSATEELIRLGPTAVPALKEALKSKDLEVLRRTESALKAIDSVSGPVYQEAVVRLLAKKAPEQAVTVLLEVVADLRGPGIVDAVAQSLARAGVPAGRPIPALVQALADKVGVRREVAGEAIARAGDAEARKLVLALLNDPEVLVRLRVAAVLLERGEAAALPVLVKLLELAPIDRAYEVESLLLTVAREQAPEAILGKTAETRKNAVAAWQGWFDKVGRNLDLAKVAEERSKPGPLLCSTLGVLGAVGGIKAKISELAPGGKPVWDFEVTGNVFSVQRLPRDRVLISEYTGRKVTERTTKGDVVWTKEVPTFPIEAVRLPGGNTLIATRQQIIEVDAEGKEVRNLNRANDLIYAMTPLRNGEVALVTSMRYVRLDAQGKELSSFQLAGRLYSLGSHFAVSPNGTRVTIPVYGSVGAAAGNQGRVIEYDNTGKVIWETEVDRPTCVRRLVNGNVLVSSRFHSTIVEMDSRGKVVNRYEAPAGGRVLDAQR